MKQPKTKSKKILSFILGGFLLVFCSLKIANRYLILPNTKIDGLNVGLYSPIQAYKKLQLNKLEEKPLKIKLHTPNSTHQIESNQLGAHTNVLATIAKSRQRQQGKNFPELLVTWLKAWINPTNFSSSIEIDRGQSLILINQLLGDETQVGVKPKVSLLVPKQASSLTFEPGEPGAKYDVELILKDLEAAVNQVATSEAQVLVSFTPHYPSLSKEEQQLALDRAKIFVGSSLKLAQDKLHLSLEITDQDIISVLDPKSGIYEKELEALLENWSVKINQPPKEAVFNYDPQTMTVKEFLADQPGINLETSLLEEVVLSFIDEVEKSSNKESPAVTQKEFELPLTYTQAKTTLASSNNLGIKEEIGFGESYFYHSIPTRVHNVSVASSRVQNILLEPGKEFSFNKALGEVSRATGFQPAYIIRAGKTELGDGGGVCQVSTTLFRATLNAGLEITKRLPHSYRVSYYELDSKPGIDATVYAGETDFRFVNNTPNYILIHNEVKPEELYMNYKIYGTSDGRTSEIVDHLTWGYQPPPPPQYIDDYSLPPGATKQIDWAASGINAKFTNVIRNQAGEIISQKTYVSHYKPWSAKYLLGPNR